MLLFAVISSIFMYRMIQKFEYQILLKSRIELFGGSLFDWNFKFDYLHTPNKKLTPPYLKKFKNASLLKLFLYLNSLLFL